MREPMPNPAPLPQLPGLAALTASRPALDEFFADLASRPTTRVAFYDDSPYVPPTGPEVQQ